MAMARDVTTVGSATLLSRLLGFARDAGVAAVLGAGVLSDAFFAAAQLSNLFRRLLADGALNAAFVPLWIATRDTHGVDGARRFAIRVALTLFVVLTLIVLAGIVSAPQLIAMVAPGFSVASARGAAAVQFLRLALPYVAIAGLVAVASAVLNAEKRVAAASLGVVVYNVVAVAIVSGLIASGTIASVRAGEILSLGIVAAGFAQLLVVGIALFTLNRLWPASARRSASERMPVALPHRTRRFFARALPGLVAAGVPQLKLIAGTMVASAAPSAVSWLYYANRLYELPLGVVSVIVASVMVPLFAAGVRAGDENALHAAQRRAAEIGLGLALPAAAGLMILAEPIAAGLFQRGAFGPDDTAAVAAALTAIAIGLPGHVVEKICGAISFARGDTRTPMHTALVALGAAVLGAVFLFPRYGAVGVAGAIGGSAWIGAAILGTVLARRGWLHPQVFGGRNIFGIAAAAAVMAVALIGTLAVVQNGGMAAASTTGRLVVLICLVALGLAVYGVMLRAFRVIKFADLVRAVVRA